MTDTDLAIRVPDAKHFALVVSAGTPSNAILTIDTDGTLWIDPEHTDEVARRLLDFYCNIREARFSQMASMVRKLIQSMDRDVRFQQGEKASEALAMLESFGL
jgi:alpha-D-ribose 1-methylphosphonate 5-triphosphate synthase subunit PhnH